MAELRCPACKSDFVRRSSRRNVLERLLSVVSVYPFRCQLCSLRFFAFRWSERYAVRGVERREYERIAVQAWSRVWAAQGDDDARVVDLSMTGCALESDAKLPEGEVVRLALQPQGSTGPAIVVDGAVVRSTQPGRLGFQFIRVSEDEEGRLRQYLYEVVVSRLR
jgi:c-di-GMP-binding flagellar brake protein YcgR